MNSFVPVGQTGFLYRYEHSRPAKEGSLQTKNQYDSIKGRMNPVHEIRILSMIVSSALSGPRIVYPGFLHREFVFLI